MTNSSSPSSTDPAQAESRFLSTPVKWCFLVVLLGLNVVFLFFFDRLIPDEISRRQLLFRLMPAYFPAWLSMFLWILVTGAVLEVLWLQKPVQLLFHRVFSGVFTHSIIHRKFEFLSGNPSMAIRSVTMVFAIGYLIVKLSLISRLVRLMEWPLCLLANFVIWFVFVFYFNPLCFYFQYGDIPWDLFMFFILVFVLILSLILYSRRLKWLPLRKTPTLEMLTVPLFPLLIWTAWGYLPNFITLPEYQHFPKAICFLPDYYPTWYAPVLWTVTIATYLEIFVSNVFFRKLLMKVPLHQFLNRWLGSRSPDQWMIVIRYVTFFLLIGILIYHVFTGTLVTTGKLVPANL